MTEHDELIEKVHRAVLTDNLNDLKQMIGNVSPDWLSLKFTEAVGRDVIGYSSVTGSLKCAQYLVDEYGLDVNGTGNNYPDGFSDEPAIHKAIAAGELDMVKFLATHPKTNINTFYQDGSALECALNYRNYKAADIIIDAAPQIMDSMQWSGHARDYQMKAVEVACKYDNVRPIEYIVSRTENKEVFAKGAGVALYHENDTVFDWMVDNGVDVNEVLADYVKTPDPDLHRIDRNISRLVASGASFANGADYSVAINALGNNKNEIMAGLLVKNGLDLNVNDGALLNHLLNNKMFTELGRAFRHGGDVSLLDPVNMRDAISAHEQNKDIYRVRLGDNKYYLDAIIAMQVFVESKIDHVPTMWEVNCHMQTELVRSIRDDDAERLKELLTQNGDFWQNQYTPDDFLIDRIHHHIIGFCLENDSKNCARMVIENKLCDINAHQYSLEIASPLHIALSNHANDIAELLLEQPDIKYNISIGSTTPLERALIDRNYDGAELLLNKKPDILDPSTKFYGPIYHQIKAVEISVYGDTRPVELIIEHTPGNRVLPSSGLAVLESRTVNQSGIDKAMDKLFELGLNANELMIGVCGIANLNDYQDNKKHLELCLNHGADFSYNDYCGVRLLAKNTVRPEKFSALIDSGLDLNTGNGAILKKIASELDYEAFETLVSAGSNPALLDKPVREYVPDFDSLDEMDQNRVFFMEQIVAKRTSREQSVDVEQPPTLQR